MPPTLVFDLASDGDRTTTCRLFPPFTEDALGADYDDRPETLCPAASRGCLPRESALCPFESSWNQPQRPRDLRFLTRPERPPAWEAVTHAGSPLLILAGAGSGQGRAFSRTASPTCRATDERGQIIAITFTNKAPPMRERGSPRGTTRGACGCRHSTSACVRSLRYEHEARACLVVHDLRRAGLSAPHPDGPQGTGSTLSAFTPKMVAARISDAKNERSARQLRDLATCRARRGRLRRVRQAYARPNALISDDLIMRTVEPLRDNPLIAEHYHWRFRPHSWSTKGHEPRPVPSRESPRGDGSDGVTPAELTVVGDSDHRSTPSAGANDPQISEESLSATGERAPSCSSRTTASSTQNISARRERRHRLQHGAPRKTCGRPSGDGAFITLDAATSEHDEAR